MGEFFLVFVVVWEELGVLFCDDDVVVVVIDDYFGEFLYYVELVGFDVVGFEVVVDFFDEVVGVVVVEFFELICVEFFVVEVFCCFFECGVVGGFDIVVFDGWFCGNFVVCVVFGVDVENWNWFDVGYVGGVDVEWFEVVGVGFGFLECYVVVGVVGWDGYDDVCCVVGVDEVGG